MRRNLYSTGNATSTHRGWEFRQQVFIRFLELIELILRFAASGYFTQKQFPSLLIIWIGVNPCFQIGDAFWVSHLWKLPQRCKHTLATRPPGCTPLQKPLSLTGITKIYNVQSGNLVINICTQHSGVTAGRPKGRQSAALNPGIPQSWLKVFCSSSLQPLCLR
jgi:hypothetical protein